MSTPEGWSEVDGALEREFTFDGFPAAIAFVNRLADLAEAENHHPDIGVSYKRVTVRWTTHSAADQLRRRGDLAPDVPEQEAARAPLGVDGGDDALPVRLDTLRERLQP